MKQNATNEWKDGLNLDLHPIVTPNTVLTDNLNGTFITYNGNEFCLQNDRGNKQVAKLTDGYTPIGIKEHNGILYIISVNGDKTEIGTFPAPYYPNVWDNDLYEEEFNGSFKDKNEMFHYAPLHVLEGHAPLTNADLGYTNKTPITIEIQDSYDGSVNLILAADERKPRMINSGFSVLSNDRYKFINRDQSVDTNIYTNLDKESELIRTSNILTNIDLIGVQSGGQLKGGNYTFYIKFGDADYNQTDVVAESGIVSIFNGNDGVPSTISGTLADERTDKMVGLTIRGLFDESVTPIQLIYSKIYIYFTREYSDTQGYRMTECGMLTEPIDLDPFQSPTGQKMNYQDIWITGFEQQTPVNVEELNVDYHTIDSARAEAQHSNMLFLGNVGQKETFKLYHKLENYTKNYIETTLSQNNFISNGDSDTNEGDDFSDANYYSVKHIYNELGYWPDEWYRFGVVYVLNDGSTTPVFNMEGGIFTDINTKSNTNEYGVFKTPKVDILKTQKPLGFKFTLTQREMLDPKVMGWFIVRQKRIPTTICQGLSIGTDKRSYLPVIPYDNKWYIESFLSLDRSKTTGEEWQRSQWSAEIINTSGSIHILRPFLETFGANGVFSSISGDSLMNADYLVSGFDNGVLKKWTESEYISEFDNTVSELTYQDECILIKETNLDQLWSNIDPEEQQQIWFYRGNVWGHLNESGKYDVVSPTIRFVYVSHTRVYGSEQLISGEGGSFYIKDDEEIPLNEIGKTSSDKLNWRFISESDNSVNSNAILSLDPCVISSIGNVFDGSKFDLQKEYTTTTDIENVLFKYNDLINANDSDKSSCQVVFIDEDTRSKVLIDEENRTDSFVFSNVAGNGSSAGDFERTQEVFGVKTGDKTYVKDTRITEEYGYADYYGFNSTHNVNLIRGQFTPFIGLNKTIDKASIYSIKRTNISDSDSQKVREQDNSEYYAVSKREYISESEIYAYRGDCYICKVAIRVLRNFIDNTAPVTNTIVDPLGWERWVRQRSLYGGDQKNSANGGNDVDSFGAIVDYSELNLSDLNAVDLGYWVTFPCLSSYNLGLRSLDTFHTDEMALLGSPRSFYPLSGASAINKVGDSYLLNDGLSATVGRKRYNLMPDVPYSKSEFANRIMFSNVNVTDAFTNGYRTFQGLAYKDYDKQYGAITKLISLGQNIFVVMEHGLGLVPVNPKALMQTTTGEAIHIYGYGVLPDEMTIISQDYGSKYEHSVIRTPIGIYGIDVDAKKIWRFSDKQGFETISDMKIETYLKDNLKSQEIEMGSSDIRTHYNGKKGDLMFTWYNNGEIYSICYNERQNLWVTRYDWTPIVSENINDEFYSLNKAFIAGTEESDPTYSSDYRIWDHHYEVGRENNYVSTWYDNDRGFEFEFVVSDPIGVSKIFENLQIISNNVSPEELQITVIGDDYTFKRDEIAPIYERKEYPDNVTWTTSNIHENNKEYRELENTVYKWDWRLHQTAIVNTQKLRDIYKHGRRLGNMQYKNGMWFIQIDPLRLDINVPQQKKEVRIRDKWAKIRIRYSGKDLAIITAIRTLINV